ncbi:methyltransferase family protein [Gynurincola endophyticus]|uniref:methyltransferase family protein n=1 Tax=Gynurincola endophyticus TaxID=2479004 RepID=UPI000F8EF279|nr:isoprenylcysteine carboxylmethyltransferase family protein [Gynurincola endophyticus]
MALHEELESQGNWLFKYRSYLPLFVLFIGTIMYIRTELYPQTFFLENTPSEFYYERMCLFVSLLGLLTRIITVGYTPANTSGRNVKAQVAETLNTTGIYSMVRHPLYLGNYFMWLGLALMSGNFWFIIAFSLFYWLYYERIMFAEEQFLRNKFGKTYTDWAEHTPAFIPSLHLVNYKKSPYTFSWKKVLKKEKNGLVAVFLLFTFFNVTGKLIEHKTDYDYFLLSMTVTTGILYLLLKYLKKYTTVLNEEGR